MNRAQPSHCKGPAGRSEVAPTIARLLVQALLCVLVLRTGAFAAGDDLLIEAEDGVLIGVEVDSTRQGYSGSGYVTGFDEPGDSLRLQFEIGKGIYEIRFAIAQSRRIQTYSMWVDGVLIEGAIVGGGAFTERRLAEHRFQPGSHEIVFKGGFDVDYVRLIPVQYDPPTPPESSLTNPVATESAHALYNFLQDQYGRYILSGQQTSQDMSELAYVEFHTGRTPAIGVFDLIDYSPSRIEHGANPANSVERWIDWAAMDGMVSLSWHWNAPTDLINSQTQPWWSGFYTRATTFDIEAVLSDTTSARYGLLLRDIDAIAVQLRKFLDADVPVLWRPLHEAAGGWFWWGAKGPDAFKKLWRLLYDRLVGVHELNHLIWVYTHQPGATSWYPGDDVVDIIGRDVYADDHSVTMKGDWSELQEYYGSRKLIALSESGTLPDPEVITDFGIWWSWFSLWTGGYIRDVERSYLARVYNSELVMTRDELPNWRGAPVASELHSLMSENDIDLYPNPTTNIAALRLRLSRPSDLEVQVYNAVGQLVDASYYGIQPAGEFRTSLRPGRAAGVYVVRILTPGQQITRALVVTH